VTRAGDPRRGARGPDGRRPLLHYEPSSGWLNDPNGLVHHDGEWHLCYQHHPASSDWGPMHWGHAVSTDLTTWTDLPIALHPDEHGAVYSGSAVVDHHGTAGFGAGALVAIYTQFTPTSQVQSIAGSVDRGRTWQVHDANPVLAQPPGLVDFRDPKVCWYDDGRGGGHWVMVLAAGGDARFYVSGDLIGWEPAGVFAPEPGRPHGVWETPDLFALPADGDAVTWVLTAGAAEHGPAGGSATRYWTGTFDGEAFAADGPSRWADHGADFYAAQSWSDVPDGRRIWVAWMSNWVYAAHVPARAARGQMTLPRQLQLAGGDQGPPVLTQQPVDELRERLGAPEAVPVGRAVALDHGAARVTVRSSGEGSAAVDVAGGVGGARVVHDIGAATLSVRRTDHAGVGHRFAGTHRAPLGQTGATDLDVWIDHSSVEVFADGGRVCVTDLVPDLAAGGTVRVTVTGDAVRHAELCTVTAGDAL
jgi:fructan beta-fructosidase